MRCPNCGKEVPPEEHFFCPFCGKSLLTKSSKSYGKLPIASGILTLIASVLIILAGLSTIDDALTTYGGYGYGFIGGTNIFFWVIGIFQVIAFSIGLTGSIFQIRKKQIPVAIFSNVLLLVSAAILVGQSYFVIQLSPYYVVYYDSYLYYAVPLFVLLILSTILIVVSRKEFKD